MMVGCSQEQPPQREQELITRQASPDATQIVLSDSGIIVSGDPISSDETAAVYTANDIVFYLEGQGFTYGEGEEADEHSQAEADRHTVVHITQPGEYVISGKLSAGQIAVDLGEDAADDPNAVVTLVLKNADITCTVAPAVIFYNVYECGKADEDSAAMEVDTSAAGANVIIADGSENTIRGSYVARIYKSVELNEDGTAVIDSKKLHKYDGAFYSKMSMNIYGEQHSSGKLNIYAENEGLDSELHLSIFSGNIHIESGNDGINTNEDNVSVTRIAGGSLEIVVTGATGEGDGIDSNGWLVIDGGNVTASACGFSGDAGIDADLGVYIRGGRVVASGNMFDRLEGNQACAVFTFQQRQTGGKPYTLKNEQGKEVLSCTPANDFQYLILSSPALTAGDYTLWQGGNQLSGSTMAGMGGMMPGGMGQGPNGQRPDLPEGMTPPDGQMPGGQRPDGQQPPEPPEGGQMPQGQRPGGMGGPMGQPGEVSTTFTLVEGANFFQIAG
jgi:hypothetical protein